MPLQPMPVITGLIIGIAVMLMGVTAPMADDVDLERTITLSGQGVVNAAPDMAAIVTGVTTQRETAAAALKGNSAAMTRVMDVLTQSGIAGRDIQTTDFSVSPRYEQTRDGRSREIVGYEVRNAVMIRVRDIEALGGILDTVVTAGANQIGRISFDVSNAEELEDTARERAVRDAERKAKIYASAAGVELGDVVSISEQTQHGGPRPMMMEAARASGPPPIAGGEMSVSVQVDMRWELDD